MLCGSFLLGAYSMKRLAQCRFRLLRRFGVRPTRSGSTSIRALTASWNVSGCNETGFAFGMTTLSECRTLQLRQALWAMLWDVLHVAPFHTRALLVGIHDLPYHARLDRPLIERRARSTFETTPVTRQHFCAGCNERKLMSAANRMKVGMIQESQRLLQWREHPNPGTLLRPDRSARAHQLRAPHRYRYHLSLSAAAAVHSEYGRSNSDISPNVLSEHHRLQPKMRAAFQRMVRQFPRTF